MSSDSYRAMLLFGAPGSGKGTQGKLLTALPGFAHVATGDIFRSLDPSSESGRIFHEYSDRGELVPDDFTLRLWREHMEQLIERGDYRPADQLLCLDGIPRNLRQAEALDQYIEPVAIIHLAALDTDAMVERMLRRARKEGRDDDADEAVIRNRFEVYRNETHPMLEHYGEHLITQIDPMGTPAEVLCAILKVIAPLQARMFGNVLAK
ncbi:MAG: adenylate kinase family protein [Planctomycetota bacterium]